MTSGGCCWRWRRADALPSAGRGGGCVSFVSFVTLRGRRPKGDGPAEGDSSLARQGDSEGDSVTLRKWWRELRESGEKRRSRCVIR
jgi:hypothetical protein